MIHARNCHSDRSEPTVFSLRSRLRERIGSRSGGTLAQNITPPSNTVTLHQPTTHD